MTKIADLRACLDVTRRQIRGSRLTAALVAACIFAAGFFSGSILFGLVLIHYSQP